MSAAVSITAVRSGLNAGRIEIRQSLTNGQDIVSMLFIPAVLLVVALFRRGSDIGGTGFSFGSTTLASLLGMVLAFNGLQAVAFSLLMEREDGTLLRAKAAPNGMVAYLVSKIIHSSVTSLVTTALLLVPGLLLFEGVALNSAGAWFTLAWVLALGLLATMPIGAVLGSLLDSPRNISVVMFPLLALFGISGIFFPMTEAPEWLQFVAQVFPVYWLGLGMRAALLPDAFASVEIGDSWRLLETFLALGAWSALGLVLAPVVLRRMARKESGSAIAARKETAMRG
ncbi:ABC transporter permease [Streptomyces anulatus]|uniref:ABC transporter permease n=1 Tax=Streptomyces anulatus TaxID=1892 RepID=UPI0021509F95|nr:ABC transporter permease [Streptomyces anulatus]WSU32348.1 ABC transporter permease [Streptomyces anulatus]WSW86264.1 ABC transporter permease [Streptomyces anulatus]